jgi:hypothetical protein
MSRPKKQYLTLLCLLFIKLHSGIFAQIVQQTTFGGPALETITEVFNDTKGRLIICGNTTDWYDLQSFPQYYQSQVVLRKNARKSATYASPTFDLESNRLAQEDKGGWILYLDEELEEQKKWKLKNTELPFLDLAAQMSDQSFVCFAHAFISEPTSRSYFSLHEQYIERIDSSGILVWKNLIYNTQLGYELNRIPKNLEVFKDEYRKGLLAERMYSPIQIRNTKQVFEQKDGSLLLLASLNFDDKTDKKTFVSPYYFQVPQNDFYALVHINISGVQDWYVPLHGLPINGEQFVFQEDENNFWIVQNYAQGALSTINKETYRQKQGVNLVSDIGKYNGEIRLTKVKIGEKQHKSIQIDGNGYDFVEAAFHAPNGDIVLIGGTSSTNGSFSGNLGNMDILFTRVNKDGTLASTQTIGTPDYDLYLAAAPYGKHYAILVEQQGKKVYKMKERDVFYKIYIIDNFGNTISVHDVAGLPIDLEVKKLIHSGNDIFQIVGNKLNFDGNILIDTDVYIAQYQLAK